MPEINYAENDKRLMENPTLSEAKRMGSTHKAYGWGANPPHGWSCAHVTAYMEGYREQTD